MVGVINIESSSENIQGTAALILTISSIKNTT